MSRELRPERLARPRRRNDLQVPCSGSEIPPGGEVAGSFEDGSETSGRRPNETRGDLRRAREDQFTPLSISEGPMERVEPRLPGIEVDAECSALGEGDAVHGGPAR